MSFRERLAKLISPASFTPKLGATNHRPAYLQLDGGSQRKWRDQVHPHQPLAIYHKRTGFSSLAARDYQSKQNPALWKMSYGVSNFLLRGTPYPFMYAEIDIDESTTENQEENKIGDPKAEKEDTGKTAKGDSAKLAALNEGKPGLQSSKPMQRPMSDGSMEFPFDQDEEEGQSTKRRYKIRKDLMDKYHTLWLEDDSKGVNMFLYTKEALSKALAIKTSVICKPSGMPTYWTFGADRIRKLIGKHRLINKVEIEWYPWYNYEDTTGDHTEKEGLQTFTVGKDCVLITPFPSAEDPLGRSFLQSVWDMGIYQQQNRFIHSLFLWNGGVTNRIARYPNTLEAAYKNMLEQSFKAPWLHPGVQIPFPSNSNPEHIHKAFQFEATAVGDMNWDIANTLNSQDTPFPKSFIEGNVESGALGGNAPEVDKEKEEEEMFRWFYIVDSMVKKVNKCFFGATDEEFKNVVIIPWCDSLLDGESENENMDETIDEPEEKKIKEEKPPQKKNAPPGIDIQPKKFSIPRLAKLNSVTDTAAIYDGNLLKEGWLPQDDGTKEWLSGEEIRKFVEDPKSSLTGYIYNDYRHPDKPEEVLKHESMGTYEIIGYNEKEKQDVTIFHVYETDAPDEIFTSPMYYSRDKPYTVEGTQQTTLDVRNAIFTESPRSLGGTKATKRNKKT